MFLSSVCDVKSLEFAFDEIAESIFDLTKDVVAISVELLDNCGFGADVVIVPFLSIEIDIELVISVPSSFNALTFI